MKDGFGETMSQHVTTPMQARRSQSQPLPKISKKTPASQPSRSNFFAIANLHLTRDTDTMGKSEKKEKKEKKEKRSEVDGVKKPKKEKKDKKERSPKEVDALLAEAKPAAPAAEVDGDEEMTELRIVPKEALVPFANPLADEKQTKKVLKSVKKG